MSKALLVDLYELTMAQVYFKHKRDTLATFDLFIRSPHRPFYVACGVDEALNYLKNLRFKKEDIDYLRSLNLFEEDFLNYLKNFKFNGEVWGVNEPEIVFSQEPILRVSGNLIEAQIIESALLNTVNLATTLATKAARVVFAAKNRAVYDFSLRRTQGEHASLAAAKYSYMVGAKGTSNVYAGLLYGIPVAGTMAHSFIMSFEREILAFLAFALQFPARSILLVDTYNTKEAIASAIKVAKFLKNLKGFGFFGIRLDSGNLEEEARQARKILDKEGLRDALIFASGNLDEYKIERLIAKGTTIDAFGVGTNMGCSSDLPFCDVIYKLVEIKEKQRGFIPTMKLSRGKTTLPSRKQIFRFFNKRGIIKEDLIGLGGERFKGRALLKKLICAGKILYKEKSLEEKRKIFEAKARSLPAPLKKSNSDYIYSVKTSGRLSSLADRLKEEIKRRIKPKIIFMDIDTQNDFLDKKGTLYVKHPKILGENLKKLIGFAEKNKILVISSQDTHTKNDVEFKQFPPHCTKGSRGHKKLKETYLLRSKVISARKVYSSQKLESFFQRFSQIILEKDTLDIFSNPNTANILKELFPDKVVVFGVVTEYCVSKAVEGLIGSGFSVTIVTDAIKEISKKEKNRLFSLWKKKRVEFTTTSTLLKSLSSKH